MGILDALILLLHVCKHWRAIAFGTQKLLAPIYVPSIKGTDTQASHRLVEWIGRAEPSPLSVVLDERVRSLRNHGPDDWGCVPKTPLAQIADAFHSLLSRSTQWHDADFRFSYEEMIAPNLHSSLYGRLPALERLRVDVGYTSGEATPIALFEEALRLQSVILQGLAPFLGTKSQTRNVNARP